MLNNNNHNSSCAFQEQIVSYIYDEASVKEKNEFVAHLDNCSGCNEEISGFGFVRSSIQEWKKEEIFALEMPALEIPKLQTANSTEKPAESLNVESWFDRMRKLFSLSPKLAFGSAAFAVLAVCAGLGLFILNFSNESDVAGNSNRASQNEFAANVNEIKEEAIPNLNSEPQKSEFVPTEVKPEQVKFNSPKDSPVKASDNSKGSVKNKVPNRKPNNTMADNNINKINKTNNIRKQETPKLSDLNEEEDKSLRLADLFSEIGTE